MSATPENVVIVGASATGLTTAQHLRRQGYEGKLTLVGDDRLVVVAAPGLVQAFVDGRHQEPATDGIREAVE